MGGSGRSLVPLIYLLLPEILHQGTTAVFFDQISWKDTIFKSEFLKGVTQIKKGE
jgi:hypothetical protein